MKIIFVSCGLRRLFLLASIISALLYGATIQLSIHIYRNKLGLEPMLNAINLTQPGVLNSSGMSVINPICPENRSGYCVVANFKSAEAIVGYEDSVTLSTQGTVNFLNHVEILCARWMGPISVSVYAPGFDFPEAEHTIQTLRSENECIRKWVSWHIIYDSQHPPTTKELVLVGNKNKTLSTYFDSESLPYPINVARNTARLNSNTKYILPSDIELYPSKDVIPMFLDLIKRLRSGISENITGKKEVFVLPVFEVQKGVDPPNTKDKLLSLYGEGRAVSFHKYVCDYCHRIPNLTLWLKTNSSSNQGMMTIFLKTKRYKRVDLSNWEPFYIGTNEAPLFDERLSWNGRLNKMQNAFELCLLDYDLNIIDGAFLTHAPGFKLINSTKDAKRSKFMEINARHFGTIKRELYSKYGRHEIC